MHSAPILFGIFGGLGPGEIIVVGIIAVLLFGKRLPDVARSWGGYYQQFRKGLSDIQRQMDVSSYVKDVNNTINNVKFGTPSGNGSSSSTFEDDDHDDYDQPTAPKFEPPTEEPTEA